jgi:nucleoside-diphosphate-sugar epimerase
MSLRTLDAARVLVTGAAGFIGANLVHQLLDQRADVIALVRPNTNLWRLRGVQPIRTIVRDIQAIDDLAELQPIDFIFHLATAAVDQRVHDVDAMIQTNVGGTFRILRAAERLRVHRVIHVGSSGEYGPAKCATEDRVLAPNSEYGASKAAATLLARAFAQRTGLPVITLRPFSVFGPLEAPYRLVPSGILRALDGESLQITGGTQTRDYVFVDDVVTALISAAVVPGLRTEIFNICTGISTSVRDMATRVAAVAGGPPPIVGAKRQLATEMWETSGNPEHARQLLGWSPQLSLDAGIERTVDWFKRARGNFSDIYSA